MSVVLYFSKINLNSDQIYEVYEDKKALKKVLNRLYVNINEEVEYQRNDLRVTEGDVTFTYTATYRFNLIEKLNEDFGQSIVGLISKKAPLYFNEEDATTGELTRNTVENTELIHFYFDVKRELVVFYTTSRFGFQEFNQAFGELLNSCMNNKGTGELFHFNVALYKNGLDVNELKTQLKGMGKLRSLKVDIIPPNPDDDLLDEIEKNAEEFLKDIKESNITHKSILFESKSNEGINLNGKAVQRQLNEIENIHSKLTTESAIKNGYVNVDATNTEGRVYSTNDSKPVKDQLDEKPKDLILFARSCKKKVENLFKQLI